MTLDPMDVLVSLYREQREGIAANGWVSQQELLETLNVNYVFAGYDQSDLWPTLETLVQEQLIEPDECDKQYHRFSPDIFSSLDEWSERVLEALAMEPRKHVVNTLGNLVARKQHLEVPWGLLSVILEHLEETYPGAIETKNGFIRIRTEEWLKRCTAQARSS